MNSLRHTLRNITQISRQMSQNVPEAIFLQISFRYNVECSIRYTIKTKINFVFHNFLFLHLHYFLLFTCKVIAIPLNLCANKIQMSTATPHKSPPIFFFPFSLNENNSYVHQIDFQIKTLFLLNKTHFPLYQLSYDASCFFFLPFFLFYIIFFFFSVEIFTNKIYFVDFPSLVPYLFSSKKKRKFAVSALSDKGLLDEIFISVSFSLI